METRKGTEIIGYRSYDRAVIGRLRAKYGTSPHFIYASLRGDRTSETSARICADYAKAERRITEILETI